MQKNKYKCNYQSNCEIKIKLTLHIGLTAKLNIWWGSVAGENFKVLKMNFKKRVKLTQNRVFRTNFASWQAWLQSHQRGRNGRSPALLKFVFSCAACAVPVVSPFLPTLPTCAWPACALRSTSPRESPSKSRFTSASNVNGSFSTFVQNPKAAVRFTAQDSKSFFL